MGQSSVKFREEKSTSRGFSKLYSVFNSQAQALGYIFQAEDGFYAFEPLVTVRLDEQMLMELALKLSDLNVAWNDLVRQTTQPASLSPEVQEDVFTNSRTGAIL